MAEKRIPKILEKQIQGRNQTQIAEDLGVSRMTTYRDRQTSLYRNLWEEVTSQILKKYVDNLLELADSETSTEKLEGTKEMGRHLRTGITKQTRHTEDINIKASIDITEQRKKADELIKVLELTPDQYKILEENVEPENLDK